MVSAHQKPPQLPAPHRCGTVTLPTAMQGHCWLTRSLPRPTRGARCGSGTHTQSCHRRLPGESRVAGRWLRLPNPRSSAQGHGPQGSPPASPVLPCTGSEVFLQRQICPRCQSTRPIDAEARTHLFQLRLKLLSINKQAANPPKEWRGKILFL